MKHMYANLNRYWKLGKTAIGAPWRATNGVLQGCGVSVVLLNSMVTLWLRAVSMEGPSAASAVPGGYADDIRGTANKPAAVQQIVDITDSYAALSGQELNADKCFVFADLSKPCALGFHHCRAKASAGEGMASGGGRQQWDYPIVANM